MSDYARLMISFNLALAALAAVMILNSLSGPLTFEVIATMVGLLGLGFFFSIPALFPGEADIFETAPEQE